MTAVTSLIHNPLPIPVEGRRLLRFLVI